MRTYRVRNLLIVLLGLVLLMAGVVYAQPAQQDADPDEDMIARGEYLVKISGCDVCHTPFQEQFNDFENISFEDIQTLAFFEEDALDEERYMAGGRVFDLGPAGVVIARNLTPDEETGLGAWTDEEIKAAIQVGIARDGHQLLPLMPYPTYNHMADEDLDAVVAFLRSLEPVENDVGPYLQAMPPLGLEPPAEPIVAPDPDEMEARGAYLMTSVLVCSDCHTPLDPETGAPDFTKFLAGGQPFEGPWGIVYGGNITPDEDTGIGDWTAEELARVIVAGVRPDGRRTILMPWQSFSNLTPEDLDAVVDFLQNQTEPLTSEAPAPSVAPDFEVFVDSE